jgi:hypothetical protein
MTDYELRTLKTTLGIALANGELVAPTTLAKALEATEDLIAARKYFRITNGHHEDGCNSIMGWNDTTCDCPHAAFKKALLGDRA